MQKFPYVMIDHELDGQIIKFAQWQHPLQAKVSFDPFHFAFIKQLIPQGSIVIDVGPHVGFQTLMYGIAAGKSGKLYAFEPNPYVLEPFLATCSANSHLANFLVFELAATEEDGECVFHYSDEGFCNGGYAEHTSAGIGFAGHRKPLKVRGVNLSKFFLEYFPKEIEKIEFIKIDTEGYDLPVLRSLEPLIQKAHPTIQSEIFSGYMVKDTRAHLQFLEDLGYATCVMRETEQKELGRIILADKKGYSPNVPYWKTRPDKILSPYIYNYVRKYYKPEEAEIVMKLTNGEDILSLPAEKRGLIK